MILNSQTATLIRENAARLADAIKTKDELNALASASNYDAVFSAIENLLINTQMFFDEDLLLSLENDNWQAFKGLLMIYTLNAVNKRNAKSSVKSSFDSNSANQSGPQIL